MADLPASNDPPPAAEPPLSAEPESVAVPAAPTPPPTPPRRFSLRDFFLGMVAGVLAVFLFLGLLVGALIYIGSKMMPDDAEMASLMPAPDVPNDPQLSIYGQPDRNWSFFTLDGKPATLADYQGKVVFLNFWATWCGPCIQEMPSIQKLQETVKDDGVAFVLVSDESADKIRDFIKNKNWSLTSFRRDAKVPPLFETTGIPATFILSRDGLIVFKHVGMARWDDEASVKFLRRLLDN